MRALPYSTLMTDSNFPEPKQSVFKMNVQVWDMWKHHANAHSFHMTEMTCESVASD